MIVDFIREHADRQEAGGLRWGVEPICTVLTDAGVQIAPSTYYAAKTRPVSARAVRDAELTVQIKTVHRVNLGSTGRARSTPSSTVRAFRSHGAPWSG